MNQKLDRSLGFNWLGMKFGKMTASSSLTIEWKTSNYSNWRGVRAAVSFSFNPRPTDRSLIPVSTCDRLTIVGCSSRCPVCDECTHGNGREISLETQSCTSRGIWRSELMLSIVIVKQRRIVCWCKIEVYCYVVHWMVPMNVVVWYRSQQ